MDDDWHETDAGDMSLNIASPLFNKVLKLTVTLPGGVGPQASRIRHSRDQSAKNLPDLTYGYPNRLVSAPKPAPFAECKIYYGQYIDFNAPQKRYYLWWRYNFDAGIVLPTTDTYLFVAAYEAPIFETTLQAVLDRWIALWLAYPDARAFRNYCANWVETVRSVIGVTVYDDLTLGLGQGQRRFDAAVRAGVAPEIDDVIAICGSSLAAAAGHVRPDRLRRTMQELRTAHGSDRLLAVMSSSAPQAAETGIDIRPFDLFPTRVHLMKLFPPHPPLGSRHENVAAMRAAEELLDEALALLLPASSTDAPGLASMSEIQFAETASREKHVPIHRATTPLTLPAVDTIEGLKRTLALTADEGMLTLMGLVLHLSDVKPYVEGLIAYSSEGRGYFTAAAEALGIESGLGAYRRSFYDLTTGRRAPWILEPQTQLPGMRMGVAGARFIRGLQRALLGADPRGEIYSWLCARLGEQRLKPIADVVVAFERATGVEAALGRTSRG